MTSKAKIWIKSALKKIIFKFLSHQKSHSLLYFFGHKNTPFPVMDWNDPVTHDQKIHWLIVNRYNDPDIGFYADKVRVREYVKECGFEEMLIPIYEVHEKVEDFDLSKVPDSFILKANHGSGPMFYEFVKDKNDKTHMDFALKKMKKALATDYSKAFGEYHYHYIEPLVYAEPLLTDGHERLNDYKIYVFNGKARFVEVSTERTDTGKLANTYDINWNEIGFVKADRAGKPVPKPETLEQMIEAAEKLGKPFALARVDFYEVAGRPYFGEITLTPSAGNKTRFTDEAQVEIGNMINLKTP